MSEFKVGDVVTWRGRRLRILGVRHNKRLFRAPVTVYRCIRTGPMESYPFSFDDELIGAVLDPEKIFEPLVWTKKVGDWHRRFVCKHCGFTKLGAVNTGFICPTCGCEDSLEKRVVRAEWEEAWCKDKSHPEYDDEQCLLYNSKGTGMFWAPILMRNYKLVTWDHCTAGEEK